MLPDLTVLVAIVLGLMTLTQGPVSLLRDLLGTVACVLVTVALIWMNTQRAVDAAREGEGRILEAAARWVTLLPLAGWLTCLGLFGWGHLVEMYVPHELWLGRYAVFFLPAAVVFAAGWAAQGHLEQELVRRRGGIARSTSPWSAIAQGFRRNGIALVPLAVLLGLVEGIWLLGELGVPAFAELSRWLEAVPLASVGFMLAVLALLSFALPFLLRKLFATEDLPPGRIRDVLERQARVLGLRYGRLLLWKTKGRMLNAMVVGFTPRTRTIFLTDALLRHLPEDEVLAVFSHEAGHAKRHHLPLFLVLFVASAVLFQITAEGLMEVGVPDWLIMIGHLAFVWFVLFGVISRLFEREADIYGADHAADLAPGGEGMHLPGLEAPLPEGTARMMRALQRVGLVSGRTQSHRHGSIEDRVRYLGLYATDEGVRHEFRQQKRTLLRAVVAMVLVAGIATAIRLPGDIALGRAQIAFAEGAEAYEEARRLRAHGEAGEEAAWEAARRGFAAAREAVASRDAERARTLGAQATFSEADAAFHGSRDLEAARSGYETLIREVDEAGLSSPVLDWYLFQAHVDLGRMAAWSGDVAAARRHLDRAAALRPEADGAEDDWNWAQLALVASAVAAAEGDAAGARSKIEQEVLFPAGRRPGPEWDELRDDARIELERLPPAAPPAPDAPSPSPPGGKNEAVEAPSPTR